MMTKSSEEVCELDCRDYNYTGHCNHLTGAEWMGEDGHMYIRTEDGAIGHLNCWCLKETKKQKHGIQKM